MDKSAKKSSNLRLDEALRIDGAPAAGCNAALADGINAVRNWLQNNQSASLDSKKFPLTTILSKHVDGPYLDFAKEVGLSSAPYSEWVRAERAELVKHFYDFSDFKIREANPDNQPDYHGESVLEATQPELFPTLNSLIELTFLCCAANGRDGLVVLVDDAAGNLVAVQGKDKAHHPGSSNSDLPRYRFFVETNRLCELCGQVTEQAAHIIALREKPYKAMPDAAKIRRILDNGGRIMTPDHSERFCEAHSPKQNPTAYKRAWRRKEFAHALRRVIILVRQAFEQPPHILLDRQLAFALASGIKGHSLLEKAVKVVDDYYAAPLEVRRDKSNDSENYRQVKDFYRELLEALRVKGDPLYPLLLAVSDSEALDAAIDAAFELGVIPRDVASHFGFVFNTLALLTMRREDIPKLSDYLLPNR